MANGELLPAGSTHCALGAVEDATAAANGGLAVPKRIESKHRGEAKSGRKAMLTMPRPMPLSPGKDHAEPEAAPERWWIAGRE